MNWHSPTIQTLVHLGLKEDAANQDITTRALIPRSVRIVAEIRAKARGIICGLGMAEACFRLIDPSCSFLQKVRDGDNVKPGQTLATIRGRGQGILSAERTALNAVQHLSGIATYTHQQVKKLNSRTTAIYDTRKTLPGWRELEKYAVRCGGGKNHRMSLKASVLIKDNHLQICRLFNIDWHTAINMLRRRHPHLSVELEIQTAQDMTDALHLKPDQLLLDNMNPARMRKLIRFIRERLPDAEIEISGGVRSEQLSVLRQLKVERISMGRLTHSAPAFDCSLDIIRVFNSR